jgi:hypothetical protein
MQSVRGPSIVLCVLCAALLLACASAATAQGSLDQDVVQIEWMINHGSYDAAITASSRVLQRLREPDPRPLYLRGYALYSIGALGAAEADLAPLGDFYEGGQWPVASEIVHRIERMRALYPAHMQEVKVGGKVAFRVYYDDDKDWVRAIIKLLPKALDTGRSLFGVELYETPVFIFTSSPRLQAFMRVRWPTYTLQSWVWAYGVTGMLYFAGITPGGSQLALKSESDYFRGTVVHEYTHSVLHRVLGTLSVPRWLDEGVAEFVAQRVATSKLVDNDRTMRTLTDAGAIVTLDRLNRDDTFFSLTEQEVAPRSATEPGDVRPAPYAQAYHMVRYLFARWHEDGFLRFLALYGTAGNLDASFRRAFGVTLDEFYDAWLKDGVDTLARATPTKQPPDTTPAVAEPAH